MHMRQFHSKVPHILSVDGMVRIAVVENGPAAGPAADR